MIHLPFHGLSEIKDDFQVPLFSGIHRFNLLISYIFKTVLTLKCRYALGLSFTALSHSLMLSCSPIHVNHFCSFIFKEHIGKILIHFLLKTLQVQPFNQDILDNIIYTSVSCDQNSHQWQCSVLLT